jgi:hypothetical protein
VSRVWDRPIPYRLTDGYQYLLGALETLEPAAIRLGLRPEQLRRKCDREAERCGDVAITHMDAGIVAFKTGGIWRFRFPIDEPGGSRPTRPPRSR